jgi:hypothetical protein
MAKDFEHDGGQQPLGQPQHPRGVRPGAAHVLQGGLGALAATRVAPGWPAAPACRAAGPRWASSRCRPRRPTRWSCPRATPPGARALGRAGRHRRRDAGLQANDASNSAAEQALQMGMHHDGMQYYALDGSGNGPAGDQPRVHRRRPAARRRHEDLDAEKVRKAQAAHGISVIEVELQGRPLADGAAPRATRGASPPDTPFAVGGPAAGHALMRTAADPEAARCWAR